MYKKRKDGEIEKVKREYMEMKEDNKRLVIE